MAVHEPIDTPVPTRVEAPAEAVAGSLADLQRIGHLVTKLGALPVVVFWHDGRAWAVEDRCPHLGFPLHRGTVESGLVTCHWHHARFDLASGCTLDPFADDARAFDVRLDGDDVVVADRRQADPVGHLRRRLRDGLEDGLSLVVAKSVLGLLDAGVEPGEIVRTGLEFGTTYRAAGWGAGLTVLVAMANLLPDVDADDRALALVHGLTFVARDTRGQPPRFPLAPLGTDDVSVERLTSWYRRFVDTRSGDAAERVLTTALAAGVELPVVESMMFAAVTDHVFVDGGHTLDFTNKAFEALGHVGTGSAAAVLPTLLPQTARASRSEEGGEWRHPSDLVSLIRRTNEELPAALAVGAACHGSFDDVAGLAWRIVEPDDPEPVAATVLAAIRDGATAEQLGRGARVRRRTAHRPLPGSERLRGLGHGAPRVHRGERAAPSPDPEPDAGVDAWRGARRAARLPRPLPQRACSSPPGCRPRRSRRAGRLLGRAGRGRRRGGDGVRVPARRR